MDKYFKRNLNTLKTILAPLENEWKEWELEGKLNWYDKHLAMNTAAYLRYLMARATAVQFVEFYGESRERQLESILGDDYESDNTYNHNEPWTRDMVVVKQKRQENEDEAFTIGFAPHYGGDVRGNYGDFIVLTFKDFWDFAEAHDEFVREHGTTLDIDGVKYDLYWSGAGENFVIANHYISDSDDIYNDGVYIEGTEEADIIKEIKEKYL